MDHNVDKYKIFIDRGVLTAEEIRKYKDSNLSAEELNRIESKILQGEFELDAIEGFQETPEALDRLKLKKAEFFAKSQIKAGFSTKNLRILFIACIAIIFIGIGIIVQLTNNTSETILVDHNQKKKTTPIKEKLVISPVVDTISQDIIEMKPIEKKKQVLSKTIKDESIQVLQKEISEEEEIEIERINIESIETFLENPNVLNFIRTKSMPTLFFSDLKVIDYSKTYTHPINVLSFGFTGTPANKEDENSDSFSDGTVKSIEYLTYLEDAMELFAMEDYRGALSKYRTILTFYENDENAFFYGGLCLYNLNRPKTAIEYLQNNQDSDYFIFNQEANWLVAKCHYEIGNIDTTKNLLKKIINEGGFYKKQAQGWLKTMK